MEFVPLGVLDDPVTLPLSRGDRNKILQAAVRPEDQVRVPCSRRNRSSQRTGTSPRCAATRLDRHYSVFSEAMSMQNRYLTSDFTSRS